MIQYDVIMILFLFVLVANVPGLQWANFLLLTMKRRGVIRIYLPRAKMTPPGLHGPRIAQP